MKQLVTGYMQANAWANGRICTFITEEVADRETVSSFSTIRKTLYHLWDAQVIWYQRLIQQPVFAWPSHQFTGTLDEAKQALLESSRQLADYTGNITEESLQGTLNYTSLQGKPFSNKVYEVLMHVSNHGTYHRGQLVTMLRQAGVTELPSTDLIAFFRERGS